MFRLKKSYKSFIRSSHSFLEAEEILQTTLNMLTKIADENNDVLSPRWEPLVNNLAHCCRKNKRYDEALRYHKEALKLKPETAATYTAMGLVYAIKGELRQAIEILHKSLALKRDDVVTTELLRRCIEESADDEDEEAMNVVTNNVLKRQCTSAAAMLGNDTKLRGMKITYDDDTSSDTEPFMDMTDD